MLKKEKKVIEVEFNNNDIKKALLNYIRDEYDLNISYEFDIINYHIKDNTLFTAKVTVNDLN